MVFGILKIAGELFPPSCRTLGESLLPKHRDAPSPLLVPGTEDPEDTTLLLLGFLGMWRGSLERPLEASDVSSMADVPTFWHFL